MQSVNDDFDDLWRKAGNEYPLNSGGADWDIVASRLGIPPEKPKRKDRRYLWLLLLLLIPIVCIRPFPLGLGGAAADGDGAPASVARAHNTKATTQASGGPASGHDANTPSPDAVVPSSPTTGNGSAEDKSITTGAQNGASIISPDNATAGIYPNPASPTTMRAGRRNTGSREVSPASSATTGRTAEARPPKRHSRPAATNSTIAGGVRQPAGRRHGNLSAPVRSAANAGRQAGLDTTAVVKASPLSGNDKPSTNRPVAAPPAPARPSADTVGKQPLASAPPTAPADSAAPAVAKKKKPAHMPRFYAGVVGGTGLTSIKRQKSPGPGYDIGIAVGYQVNSHLSVEADVLWSRKQYFSHGKYLKNDLSYLPAFSYVRAVNGDCRMIEIPISLQYHFNPRRNGNWFAAAGFSSYLMKREEYGYDVKNLLTTYEGHYDTTLRNATRDWMALLQVSAGYRFELRRNYNLRVEPYVQLPVANAGAGRLPLTSYGLRVALVKSLF